MLALTLVMLFITGFLLWYSITSSRQTYYELAVSTAESFFESIVVTRRWNSIHGGVYVSVTDGLQPNPYLVDPLRDITDNTNRHLTKVNPAFMTRLISELMSEDLGVAYKITSLDPLNPVNLPDEWERESLIRFDEGTDTSTSQLVARDGEEPYLRYMAPLITENSCLQCHAQQGYQEGDVRGGIRVSIPYGPFRNAILNDTHRALWVFGVVFMVIMSSAGFFGYRTYRADVALREANSILETELLERERRNVEMDRLYNALDTEMQNARRAHQRLVEQRLPEPSGISLVVSHCPATYIGGDFAYAIQKGDLLIMYVTDITGHGLEGTIFGLFVKGCIESYLELVPDDEIVPVKILTYLDEQVHKGGYPSEYAVAIFLMVVNVMTRETTFSAAGFQDPPLLVAEDGSIQMLKSQGLPISPDIPVEVMEFEHHTVSIPESAFLFLGTDGIYEQRQGAQMYEQRLLKLLKECAGLPHNTINDLVNTDFRDFLGENVQDDDVTFVVLSTEETEEHSLRSSLGSLDSAREHVLNYYKDHPECEGIAMAVHELVANAIEHGNRCDVDKQVKVLLSARAVVVEDEGDGFDWRSRVQKELNLDSEQERGRGIAMNQLLVGKLVYNEKGNRVSLIID